LFSKRVATAAVVAETSRRLNEYKSEAMERLTSEEGICLTMVAKLAVNVADVRALLC